MDAARELFGQGVTPTVEQAAEAAGVSRATAYRYFANQLDLARATYPETGVDSLLEEPVSDDVEERLEEVVGSIGRQIVEHEAALRAMLRHSLEPDYPGDLPFRQGRRIVWTADALAPLRGRLPAGELDRTTTAIAAAVGIEAFVWLTDIARLPKGEALELMRWSALSILRAAVAENA